MFRDEWLQEAQPITVSLAGVSLNDALSTIFSNQPLTWSVVNKTIVIQQSVFSKHFKKIVEPPITGVVRGPDGQPIAGVNVVVKGTKKGVVTDAYGRFSIEAEQGKTLVISNIGYNASEIKVNGQNNIIVGLEITTSKLDEVQIIAYGKTSQKIEYRKYCKY